jgi:stage II sporulation protein D
MQVTCTSEAGRDALVSRAQAQGVETYTENAGPCWRVMLGSFDPPPASTYSARVGFKNDMVARGLAPSGAFWKVVTTVTGTTEYRITHGGSTIVSSDPVRVEATSGLVLVGGKPYRGAAEVAINSSGALAGINELPIEQYLYGVVPRELPPTVWPAVEAQKAQAVAARTYALSGLGKRRADGYDLLPTTSDQVYGGYAAEHPVSNQAVDGTAGVVATYEGRLIQALFSSTTGGHTSSNEEVYNSSPVPYLRGVPDAQRGQAFAHVPTLEVFKNSANPSSLRASKEGDFEADWSRYHRWTFEWTNAEISRVISDFAGRDVGRVLAINTPERGPSGRVLKIEYVTEAGTFVDTKDRIRASLKFINSAGNPSNLLSTLFFIEPVVDRKTKEVVGFAAYGGGWGHGVGLSQTGAVGMAEKKATYDEILKHYYQGITLETRQY